MPAYYLYSHAIELTLKAFLRARDLLRSSWGVARGAMTSETFGLDALSVDSLSIYTPA